jgi:TPR repeat protein
MNSKVVPLLGLVLIVAVAGFLFRNQLLMDQEAGLLSPEVQFRQGEMYERGWGRPTNTKETIKWYQRAAKNGHAEAQYRLAILYYEGERVEQDFTVAMQWFMQAANNGHVDAEYRLGWMYQNGEGVLADRVEAEKWFSNAREHGHESTTSASG